MHAFQLIHLIVSCRVTNETCPTDMVLITKGSFLTGQNSPQHRWHTQSKTIEMESYCIDRYEYPNQKGILPTSNVTWDRALELCQQKGKTLCTSAQWERACQGTEKRTYAYGNNYNRTTCNTPIQGGGPGKNPAPVAASGSFSQCQSPEGVFDLNGNVSEWVLDAWDGFPEPFNARARVNPDTWRTLRGGTMWSNTFYGHDCTSRHGHHKSRWRNIDDGFRCCRTVQTQ